MRSFRWHGPHRRRSRTSVDTWLSHHQSMPTHQAVMSLAPFRSRRYIGWPPCVTAVGRQLQQELACSVCRACILPFFCAPASRTVTTDPPAADGPLDALAGKEGPPQDSGGAFPDWAPYVFCCRRRCGRTAAATGISGRAALSWPGVQRSRTRPRVYRIKTLLEMSAFAFSSAARGLVAGDALRGARPRPNNTEPYRVCWNIWCWR